MVKGAFIYPLKNALFVWEKTGCWLISGETVILRGKVRDGAKVLALLLSKAASCYRRQWGLHLLVSCFHFNFSLAPAHYGSIPIIFDAEFPLEAIPLFSLSQVHLSYAEIPSSGQCEPLTPTDTQHSPDSQIAVKIPGKAVGALDLTQRGCF